VDTISHSSKITNIHDKNWFKAWLIISCVVILAQHGKQLPYYASQILAKHIKFFKIYYKVLE
jgi:hypothetical protein